MNTRDKTEEAGGREMQVKENKECVKAYDLMMKYMDGELDEQEALELRGHVGGCEACKADFEVYDFISEKLTATGLTNAPDGFTENVMKLVAALPSPKRIAASAFERIMVVTWGVFSILFGAGFLLVMNREAIIEYLSGVPVFSGFITALAPAAEQLGQTLGGVTDTISGILMTALGFVSDYRYVIFGAITVILASQLILLRRKLTAAHKAKAK
ncbi:MAG: zf-HC2 domain-containing protein [Defluviitaleaceae bacterium]|nr:zf-HC2 domain-containing protein [Defluviitaleaceae bacterium]MCL2837343.1 zf-HC2 domain-containing protein [Defluviitaleaceae bacterium]